MINKKIIGLFFALLVCEIHAFGQYSEMQNDICNNSIGIAYDLYFHSRFNNCIEYVDSICDIEGSKSELLYIKCLCLDEIKDCDYKLLNKSDGNCEYLYPELLSVFMTINSDNRIPKQEAKKIRRTIENVYVKLMKDDGLSILLNVSLLHSISNIISFNDGLQIENRLSDLILQKYGEKNILYAESICYKGFYAFQLEKWTESIEYMQRALELYEYNNIYNHTYRLMLHSVARSYLKIDMYNDAIEFAEKSVSLHREIYGEQNDYHVSNLLDLGTIYSKSGDYLKALQLHMRAKEIKESYSDTEELDEIASDCAMCIANDYYHMGDYSKAYKTMRIVVEHGVTPSTPYEYASYMSRMAYLNYYVGEYDIAIELGEWSIKCLEDNLPEEHTLYEKCLTNQGAFYSLLGMHKMAWKYYKKALKVLMRMDYSLSEYSALLHNIAFLEYELGRYKHALKHYHESTRTAKIAYGRYHIETVRDVQDYISKLINLKKYSEAEKYIHNINDYFLDYIASNILYLPGETRKAFWSKYNSWENDMLEYTYKIDNNAMNNDMYNLALLSKGILLYSESAIVNLVNKSNDESIKSLYTSIKQDQEAIVRLNVEHHEENHDIIIDSLQEQIRLKEYQMIMQLPDIQKSVKKIKYKWTDVRDSMDENDVAIEFIIIPEKEEKTYYALLTKKNYENVQKIRLCTVNELNSLLTNEKKLALNRFINRLYTRGNNKIYSGEHLYSLVWSPIEPFIDGVKNIYYSPVGALHQLSFQALYCDSVCLSEKYNLHLLSSTREIPALKEINHDVRALSTVIYGGIDYMCNDSDLQEESRKYKGVKESHMESYDIVENNDTRSGWNYLAGTEKEASLIHSICNSNKMSSVIYSGWHANEESIKELSGNDIYDVMHIATHGFFTPNGEKCIFVSLEEKESSNRNALLRSGLLFAGANRKWEGKNIIEGIEDGILTAEEISKLNLANFKLVTMSACETGLGEIDASEGVFGLQRAFKLAGVQTIIMSLWKVPDSVTSELMVEFYRRWMSGEEIHQAFINAKREIKKKYPKPYDWAGFVMLD